MTMRRPLVVNALLQVSCAILATAVAFTQTNNQTAQFEVASIRRNTQGGQGREGLPSISFQPGGRFVMVNAPVAFLINWANPRPNLRIRNAPQWVNSDAYDINAKAPGDATKAEMEAMLRSLLAQRFNFSAHWEEEEVDAYELVLARKDGRLGAGLRRVEADCEARAAVLRTGREPDPLPASQNGLAPCAVRAMDGALLSGGYPLKGVAERLEFLAGRPVIDRTGLDGFYEVTLRYRPGPPEAESRPGELPILFTAIQEQLGLRLQPTRAVISTIIIDRIAQPSQN